MAEDGQEIDLTTSADPETNGDPTSQEDSIVCDICLDGEVYEKNEIVFCEKCNVAVHQSCYGVKTIPKGPWFCFPCAKGEETKDLHCELCSFTGGAYKPTDRKGKWAHGLCANWIPELFEKHIEKEPPTWQTQNLDKKRFTLKCGLCKGKGACVQCSFGRCASAMHPWCALRNPRGCTRRIIRNDKGEVKWEIFCKTHAKSVGDFVKSKSKKNQASTSAAAATFLEEEDGYWDESTLPEPSSSKPNGYEQRLHEDVIDDDDEESVDDGKPGVIAKAVKELSSNTFNTVSLLEWPGISEGENMDLDHFWSFVSSHFVEDHGRPWYDFTLENLQKFLSDEAGDASLLDVSPNLARADEAELQEALDESCEPFFNEQKRREALFYAKRNLFLDTVAQWLDKVNGKSAPSSVPPEVISLVEGTDGEPAITSAAVNLEQKMSTYKHPRFSEDTEDLLVKTVHKGKSSQNDASSKKDTFKVVFDGPTRIACEFNVNGDTKTDSEGGDQQFASETAPGLIIPSHAANGSSSASAQVLPHLSLKSFYPLAPDAELEVGDKTFHAQQDLNILGSIIQADFNAYTQIMDVLRGKIEKSIEQCEHDQLMSVEVDHYEAYRVVQKRYTRQQSWHWLCNSVNGGIRDQKPGFNKKQEEALPASWTIAVEGRPAASKNTEKEEPVQDDIVCMCCFDGDFSDENGNQIIFCDGCNATLHQKCYGISEVPEGNFYCDRCVFIQRIFKDDEVDDGLLKSAVRCCLCPQQHGGLKRTTDNRWVHVCCALFAQGTIIGNLPKMSGIDIKQVPFQKTNRSNNGYQTAQFVNAFNAKDACVYCRQKGGYVVHCSHTDEDEDCDTVFHPLCAWFAGAYIGATITDETFMGSQDGQYPSGLEFEFLCDTHSAIKRNDPDTTQHEQEVLRSKYRINEADLALMPGKGTKRRRKAGAKPKHDRHGEAMIPISVAQRELAPDVYTEKICCICMKPTAEDVFNSGYSTLEMSTINLALPQLPSSEHIAAIKEKGIALSGSAGFVRQFVGELVDRVVRLSMGGKEDVDEDVMQVDEEIPRTSSTAASSSSSASAATVVSELHKVSTIIDDAQNQHPTDVNVPRTVSCAACGLTAHTFCACELGYNPTKGTWICTPCEHKEDSKILECIYCPRHGGLFAPTMDNNWTHPYCAKNIAYSVKINEYNCLEVRSIAKECKKQKCVICNRKRGLCIPCNEVGCSVFFHPLCGVRSGRGFSRMNAGRRESFCFDHLPPGVEMLPNGFWVDGLEFHHVRYSLDRARLVVDVMQKREKFKKLVHETERSFFAVRFQKGLDKAMGRKKNTLTEIGAEVSLLELEMQDSGSEYESDDEEDIAADAAQAGEFVSLAREPNEKFLLLPFRDTLGEEIQVSATWTKLEELRVPRIIKFLLSGHKVQKKDVLGQGALFKTFLRNSLEKINRIEDELRPIAPSQFRNRKEEEKFGKQLSEFITTNLTKNDKELVKFLQPFDHIKIPRAKVPKDPNKIKRGYALVPVEEDEFDPIKRDRDEEELKIMLSPITKPKSKAGRRPRNDEEDGNEDSMVIHLGAAGKKRKASSSSAAHWDEEIDASDPANSMLKLLLKPNLSDKEAKKLRAAEFASVDSTANKSGYKDFLRHFSSSTTAVSSSRSQKQEDDGEDSDGVDRMDVDQEEHVVTQQVIADSSSPSAAAAATTTPVAVAGFEKIIMPIANTATPATSSIFTVAAVGSQAQIELERVLFYVLDNLEYIPAREVDISLFEEDEEVSPSKISNKKKRAQSSSASSNKKKKKGGKKKATAEETEEEPMLCDEYKEIPYDIIHDYDQYVRKKLCLDDIQQAMKNHEYLTLAAFIMDFYELLNNARYVATINNTKIKHDTKRLAELFEQYKQQLIEDPLNTVPRRYQPPHPVVTATKPIDTAAAAVDEQAVVVKEEVVEGEAVASTSTPSNGKGRISSRKEKKPALVEIDPLLAAAPPTIPSLVCSHCNQQYNITNWPAEFPLKQRGNKNRTITHDWHCPECITVEGATLIGRRIKVWWRQDEAGYDGTIDAYDPPSHAYRVHYDDNEWEFLDLSKEPFMLLKQR